MSSQASPSIPMTHEEEATIFYEGLKLFHEKDWFEAHEVWEDIWVGASGDLKRFYQGLIQVSVTIEHAARGNPRGIRSVRKSCGERLKGLPSPMRGIDIEKLQSDLDAFLSPVFHEPGADFSPGRGRGQDLKLNWDIVPRITLLEDPFPDVQLPAGAKDFALKEE